MIALPEAISLAKQIDEKLKGKMIKKGVRNYTPDTFIFPQDSEILKNKGHKTD